MISNNAARLNDGGGDAEMLALHDGRDVEMLALHDGGCGVSQVESSLHDTKTWSKYPCHNKKRSLFRVKRIVSFPSYRQQPTENKRKCGYNIVRQPILLID
jgi:hypothetical protein